MKTNFFTVLAACIISVGAFAQATFHSYQAVDIDGDTINLSQYYGKKVMVVNTASYCSFTHQYTDLQQLYTDYQQYNFVILGFPCNNFGSQEPGADSTISDFCEGYNVTFPMMSKVDIVSGDTAEVYKWLQRADLNGVQTAHVSWNFNKFLIDEAGHWVNHFTSPVEPQDTAITNWIMSPSVLTGIEENKLDAVQIYPNPAANIVTFAKLVNINGMQLVNMMGQQVYSVAVTTDKLSIDLSGYATGMYSYRLISNNGTVKAGKLLVE